MGRHSRACTPNPTPPLTLSISYLRAEGVFPCGTACGGCNNGACQGDAGG